MVNLCFIFISFFFLTTRRDEDKLQNLGGLSQSTKMILGTVVGNNALNFLFWFSYSLVFFNLISASFLIIPDRQILFLIFVLIHYEL